MLEDLSLPPARLDLICQAMDAKRAELREKLCVTQFNLPELAGVKWRVDYAMKVSFVVKFRAEGPIIEPAIRRVTTSTKSISQCSSFSSR